MKIISVTEAYLGDESKSHGNADKVIIAENESDVTEVLKIATKEKTHITISGNRTGVCGGSVPNGGIVLSLEQLNKILGIGVKDDSYFIRVEPCVTVKQLSEALLTKHLSNAADITENAAEIFAKDQKRYFYPIDPTETEGSIGGNAATNASGPRTLKYGPTRNWICGLRVALHDGNIIEIPRGTYFAKGRSFDTVIDGVHLKFDIPSYNFNKNVKNVTGIFSEDNMDLIDVFIGSEGIFGVITRLDVRLSEWHPLVSNIMFFPDDTSALNFTKEMKKIDPEFLEFFDTGSIDLIRNAYRDNPDILTPPEEHCSAVFFDLPEDGDLKKTYALISDIAKKYGGSLEKSWGSSDRKDREMMFRFRHSVPQAIFEYVASLKGRMPGIHKMGTDMSVPEEKSDEMMNFYKKILSEKSLEYVIFGHMGNFHPHVEIILKDMDDYKKANEAYLEFALKSIELGGSPSAEHGIGKIKTEYIEMMYGLSGLEEIIRMKKILDPNNILNRGDMVVI